MTKCFTVNFEEVPLTLKNDEQKPPDGCPIDTFTMALSLPCCGCVPSRHRHRRLGPDDGRLAPTPRGRAFGGSAGGFIEWRVTPMTQEYDDSGRLIRHIDAFGYTIEYERIPITVRLSNTLNVKSEWGRLVFQFLPDCPFQPAVRRNSS